MADFDKLIDNFFKENEKGLGSEQLTSLLKEEYELLAEGKGVSGFDEKTVFIDEATKQTFSFDSVAIFPPEGGAYSSPNETQKDIIRFAEESAEPIIIKKFNEPNVSAIMVLLKNTSDSKLYGFVKYFFRGVTKDTSSWSQTDFLKDMKLARPKNATKAAAQAEPDASNISGKLSSKDLEKLPVKPTDLFPFEGYTDLDNLKSRVLASARSLIEQGSLPEISFNHINDLLTAAVENKESPILSGAAPFLPAYNKYFSEILAPISLLTGWLSTGDRKDSELQLLNYGDSKGALKYSKEFDTAFAQEKNAMLADSLVFYEKQNITVNISSKAGGGAGAALENLLVEAKKLKINKPKIFNNHFSDYPQFHQILKINSEGATLSAPIELALHVGIINEEEYQMLLSIAYSLSAFSLRTDQFYKLYNNKLSQNIKKIMIANKAKTEKESYRPAYHILSALASKCCSVINEDSEGIYNIDKAVRTLLTNSSFMQINSHMKKVGAKDAQYKSFVITYPPIFKPEKIILINKAYSGGRAEGKFSFVIP